MEARLEAARVWQGEQWIPVWSYCVFSLRSEAAWYNHGGSIDSGLSLLRNGLFLIKYQALPLFPSSNRVLIEY